MTAETSSSEPEGKKASKKQRSIPVLIFRFFSSYSLAIITMIFLIIVTLLGTLEQGINGLYESQEKWFDSIYVTNFEYKHKTGTEFPLTEHKIPLLLPGGYLLMIILSINLLCGAIVSARKNWKTPGMLITHASILFMLLAGLVSFYSKIDGTMMLYEGDTSDKVTYFHHRIVEVAKYEIPEEKEEGEEGEGDTEKAEEKIRPEKIWAIPHEQFEDLTGDKKRTFFHADFPFEIELSHFEQNCRAEPADTNMESEGKSVEGFALYPQPLVEAEEANAYGVYAAVHFTDGKDKKEKSRNHILWDNPERRQQIPVTIDVGKDHYTIRLIKDYTLLPFEVTLVEAIRELHPGTEDPKSFRSWITYKKKASAEDEKANIAKGQVSNSSDDQPDQPESQPEDQPDSDPANAGDSGYGEKKTEGDSEEKADGNKALIRMNEPLRTMNWTLFQHQFGSNMLTSGAGSEYSGFQCVSNPSDQWPLYALVTATIGLLIHFMQKLMKYVVRSGRSRQAKNPA